MRIKVPAVRYLPYSFTVLLAVAGAPASGGSLRGTDGILVSNCPAPTVPPAPAVDVWTPSEASTFCEFGDEIPDSDVVTEVMAGIPRIPSQRDSTPGDFPVFDVFAGSVQPLATHAIRDSLGGVLTWPESPLRESAARPRPDPAVQDIARTVDAWIKAWSERDADAYLRHYSAEFSSGESGFSLPQWRQQRRARLLKPDWIKVKAQGLRIEVAASGRARVQFQQDYRSPSVAENSQKVLVMRREGDTWRILAERSE